ncbi:MAG: O-antigen ligase family protein [Candidatus Parcubacteria bacterium]|nr:O-antigen ligase family protein [Candidatus Parcubacteria bacterium]
MPILKNKIWLAAFLVACFICFGFTLNNSWYALIGLIFLVLILLFIFYPMIGIYIMAFLFPFTYLQLVYQDINIPYVDLLALILFCAWVIKTIYLAAAKNKLLSAADFPGWQWMTLFVFICVLSLMNVDRDFLDFAVKYIFRPIIFFYLMYLVLPFNLIKNLKQLDIIYKIMYVLGLGLVAMGVWALIFPPVVGFRQAMPISLGGIYPLGTNHNQLAEILISIIPIGLILYWKEKDIVMKNLYLIGLILMIAIQLLTLSRAGWIALAVEFMVLFVFRFRREFKKLISPLVIYLSVLLILPAVYFMYKLTITGLTLSATLNRLKLIDVSLMLFKQHPLLGSGIGVFTQIMSQVKWYLIEYGEVLDAHGFVFKTLAETGLIGTFCFGFLLFYLVYSLYKGFREAAYTQYSWLVLGSLTMVIGSLTFQLFGTSYYLATVWFPIGVAMATLKLSREYLKAGKSRIVNR